METELIFPSKDSPSGAVRPRQKHFYDEHLVFQPLRSSPLFATIMRFDLKWEGLNVPLTRLLAHRGPMPRSNGVADGMLSRSFLKSGDVDLET
jgi:hypothetical protein